MAKSFSELQTLAIQIRDELNKKKNSAQRVGSALLDIIDNCIQNITDIKQKLSVFEHACSGFKRVSSEAQLPVTPSQEDLAKGFLVNTFLYLYVGTGGNAVNGRYFNVGDIRGPQGEPGSKGETGNTGPTGEKGEQGNSGVTGDTSDIVVINNLDGGESEEGSIKVLAAEQGKVLNKKYTELENKIYKNPHANSTTKEICKAIKELYIPYDGNDWVLAVIGRNSKSGDTGWSFKVYRKDLSKNISYSTLNNPEGTSGLQFIQKDGMCALIDWNELPDGYYKSSMTSDDYLLDKKCFDLNYSPLCSAVQATSQVNNITWNLPKAINVLSSYVYVYYEDTLIKNYERLKNKVLFKVESDSSNKQIFEGLGKILCDCTYIKFSAYIDEQLISVHTITVNKNTKETGLTKKCLFITDSYGDNTYGTLGMIGWVEKLASDDSNTLIPVGTRTNEYGKLGETYQGWSENTFFKYVPTSDRQGHDQDWRNCFDGTVSSPFMFSDNDTAENAKFDFSRYLSENAISGIDCIIFFLGMNGGDGSGIYKMIYGDSKNIVLNSIRDVLPSTPIIINMVPSYWGHKNISKINKLNGQNGRIGQNINYFSLFEGKENISIIANNGYDRIYGYRSVEANLGLFDNGSLTNDVAIPKVVKTFDHHPSTFGIHSLAYQMYNSIFVE